MYILQQMSTGCLMSLSCYSYESLTRPVCRESWRTWVNPSRLLLPALRPLIYFSFSARMGLCFAFTGDYSIYKSSSLKYILNQFFYRHRKSYRLVDRFLYHDYHCSIPISMMRPMFVIGYCLCYLLYYITMTVS